MTSSLDQQAASTGCGCATSSSESTSAAPSGTAGAPCCGSREAADAAGACCDPAAKEKALAAGTSCCG